jgi:hypothetical protein
MARKSLRMNTATQQPDPASAATAMTLLTVDWDRTIPPASTDLDADDEDGDAPVNVSVCKVCGFQTCAGPGEAAACPLCQQAEGDPPA